MKQTPVRPGRIRRLAPRAQRIVSLQAKTLLSDGKTSLAAAGIVVSLGLLLASTGGFGPFLVGRVASFAVAALALQVVVGWGGVISAGHAGFMAAGAYTYAIFAGEGWHDLVAVAIALGVTASLALVLAAPTLRTSGLYFAIITLGFGAVVQRMSVHLDSLTGGSSGLAVSRPSSLGAWLQSDAGFFIIPLGVLALTILLTALIRHSGFGRALITTKQSRIAAEALGIPSSRVRVIAMVASGSLAGMAGILYGLMVGFLAPGDFGIDLSILLLAMVIVGGALHPVGPVLGAFLLVGVAQSWAALARYDALISGLVLAIAVVLLGQGGIAAGLAKALRRWGGRRGWGNRISRRAEGLFHLGSAGDSDEGVPDDELETTWDTGLIKHFAVGGFTRGTTSSDGEAVLATEQLSVNFGGVRALHDVTLQCRPGAITGVMGPNGAGKSTLFNCISGFVVPSSGNIHYGGRSLDGMAPYRRARAGIGRSFQHLELIESLTAEENVQIAVDGLPSTQGTRGAIDSRRVVREIGQGIPYWNRPVADLSFGQRKIVSFLRTAARQPGLLMLDEPASGLSREEVDDLLAALKRIHDVAGTTSLIIEHNVGFLRAIADTIYVLHNGAVIATGSPAEIETNEAVQEAYL